MAPAKNANRCGKIEQGNKLSRNNLHFKLQKNVRYNRYTMSKESSGPDLKGWTRKESRTKKNNSGKPLVYYECKTLPGGYKSQFEVPTEECPTEGVTLRTPATSATVSLIGANGKRVEYKVEKIGGKRKQKKKYGKKTRKLRNQKKKQ